VTALLSQIWSYEAFQISEALRVKREKDLGHEY